MNDEIAQNQPDQEIQNNIEENSTNSTNSTNSDSPTSGLDVIDLKILELKLINPSLTDAEIGEKVGGLSRNQVVYRKNQDAFKSEMERIKSEEAKEISERYSRLGKKALDVFEEVLDSEDPKDKYFKVMVSKELLKSQQVVNTNVNANVKTDQPYVINLIPATEQALADRHIVSPES